MSRDQTMMQALRAGEAACLRWSAESLRASALATDDDGAPSWRASALDASYLGAATARAIAHCLDHDWGGVLTLVQACALLAGEAAVRWRAQRTPTLRDAITAACECAIACGMLVQTIVPRARPQLDGEGCAA